MSIFLDGKIENNFNYSLTECPVAFFGNVKYNNKLETNSFSSKRDADFKLHAIKPKNIPENVISKSVEKRKIIIIRYTSIK